MRLFAELYKSSLKMPPDICHGDVMGMTGKADLFESVGTARSNSQFFPDVGLHTAPMAFSAHRKPLTVEL